MIQVKISIKSKKIYNFLKKYQTDSQKGKGQISVYDVNSDNEVQVSFIPDNYIDLLPNGNDVSFLKIQDLIITILRETINDESITEAILNDLCNASIYYIFHDMLNRKEKMISINRNVIIEGHNLTYKEEEIKQWRTNLSEKDNM